jgi:hypothetical protein
MDMKKLTEKQLRNVVENHQLKHAFDKPEYAAALDELQRRSAPSLDLDTTIRRILESANSSDFLSYGDVAKANGCDWVSVRRQMPRHLDLVLAKAHARGAPLITAIVVNDANRLTGALEASSLSGFIAGAERLGFKVEDAETFLRAHQAATFDFARINQTL